MTVDVIQFGYNSDNYGALVRDQASGKVACIDAGDAQPILDALAEQGWTLDQLWITHHHWDHTDDLGKVKQATGCKVIGPDYSGSDKLALDSRVADGDTFMLGATEVQCLHTPGHTLYMINYYLPAGGVVFTGDTLFSLGCGRMFEGDAATMQSSMAKLRALPDETVVYCGHEYTQANAAFAVTVDPDNTALAARAAEVAKLRAAGQPTVPVRLGDEKATNPFLRYDDSGVRSAIGLSTANDVETFGKLRSLKDNF